PPVRPKTRISLTLRVPEMTLVKSIAVLAVLLAAVAYFAVRTRPLYRMLRLGPNENRFDHIPERIRSVLSYVGLHTRMFRNLYSGILHFFIFWGFVVLLTAIIQAFGEGVVPGFSLAPIGGTTWIAFLQDLFGILVLVGVLMGIGNRPALLVYIPSSKHLHIIVAIPNVFFRKLGPKAGAMLAPIDLEHAEHYGVSQVTQWSWKNLLDLYSCTECGRCQEQCPAFLTGKPLNPKMIIVD